MSKKKKIKSKNKPERSNHSKKEVSKLPGIFGNKRNLISLITALVITLGCFWNTTQNDFVNWDDDRNFYENELVTTANAENFWSNTKKIFSTTVIGNYNPLTIWSFAVEKRVFGLDKPGKWHGTNVFLHLICVFFVFRICLLLGVRWQGSLLVALLFGIHPMRVESVAWVTERKDVLFGAFYLSALYHYIKGKIHGKLNHILIITLFTLSLFSKIQAVILPLSMLAIDFYLNGRIDKKDILAKAPYFFLSILFGLIGIIFLKDQGSLENTANYPAWQRIFIGSYSYMIYIIKAIIPFRLSPLYPYAPTLPAYYYPTILLGPGVLYALYYTYKNELRIWFFGLSFFTVNIMFLLQILGAGQGFLADRFTYIAYFGLFFIAGYFFDLFFHKNSKYKISLVAVGLGLTLVFGYMTIIQNTVWKNSETLWSHVLNYYQHSTLPYGNRANYLRSKGRIEEALADYSKSISLNPEGDQAYNSRARLYFDIAKGPDKLRLALNDYNRAISLNPNDGEFYVNRGATHARLGDINNAIKDMNQGLTLKPNHAVGYMNRSIMHNSQGNVTAALSDIESYIKLNQYNKDIWFEKAKALRSLNRLPESIKAYSRAIQLDSDNSRPNFYYERGRTYYVMQKQTEAKSDIQMAVNMGFKNIDPEIGQALGIR